MLYEFLCKSNINGVFSLVICIVLCAAVGYFIGSLNFSVILSRKLYKDDVRLHGSGNGGSTNMLRNYGLKAGLITLFCDMAKTALALAIGLVSFAIKGMFIAGLFAIVGHSFPAYFKFKGGKGFACFVAIVLMSSIVMGLDYVLLAFLPLLVIYVVIVVGTKYVSLASIITALLYPVILNRIDSFLLNAGRPIDQSVEIVAVIIGIFIAVQHRENIKRLINGEENKVSFKKKNKEIVKDDKEDDKR